MLFGGSRSGKTFLSVYAIVVRALKAPKSRHLICRFRFNAAKASIIFDTLPKVMELCFPGVEYHINKTDWIITMPNGSEIWVGGLDDKERTEKILGQEFATVYPNECSQIPWSSIGLVMTRLAQNCKQADGVQLPLRMIFDCNPPDKNHWTYKLFIKKVDPDTNKPMVNAEDYGSIQVNPSHNVSNLPASYLKMLEGMTPEMKKRFFEGEFKDANPNATFKEAWIDRWREEDGANLPEFVRIVVGVDPSGADEDSNKNNDDIGIYIAALGTDGVAYLLEDCTVKSGPAVWGKVTCSAYERYDADVIVGEQNFGGGMVKYVIKSVDPGVNYKQVTASRGKQQRAEPFARLFMDGLVRVVGRQTKLEEELSGFTSYGYTGAKSPNVADAAFWCLAELFPAIVGNKTEEDEEFEVPMMASAWR